MSDSDAEFVGKMMGGEIERLRAEVERLTRERDEARAGWSAECDAHHATEIELAIAREDLERIRADNGQFGAGA